MSTKTLSLNILQKNNDLVIAGFIVGIVLMIIIPLPPVLLDFLLVFNITLSLVIFLITLFTQEVLQFSIFPVLLLITTLFRLALNISSTRLILSSAYAGKVISAFGDFVVRGNYIVGMVVFLIIMVVQFVVITNGASRVAEVAARFTLDAMPGKQMAIDADFGAGLITEDEATQRRLKLQKEADFFGSMDGATKFVKGDVVAGAVITLINIIGGLIIGCLTMGKGLLEALQTYTVLTIGDGLVSQIPALLISTATGIMVTRSRSGQSFGHDAAEQMLNFPKVLSLVSVILAVLGLVPALPNILFLGMAAAAFYFSYLLRQAYQEKQVKSEELKAQLTKQGERQPENVLKLFKLDPLEIEIGYNLVSLTDEGQGGDLLERLVSLRKQCVSELGIYVRPIRIRDNLQLEPNKYVFKIRGISMAEGELMPHHFLAITSGNEGSHLEGIPTKEPAFGLPAFWIRADQKFQAETQGFTVVDAANVLITHLTEFIKKNAHELLAKQDVKELLDVVKENDPAVVDDLIPGVLTLGEIQKVLQQLLKEGIPIRDLVTILEALSDAARTNREPEYLIQCARIALRRTISHLFAGDAGKLYVITLDSRLEQKVNSSLQTVQEGLYPVLEPSFTQVMIERLQEVWEKQSFQGINPVLLCSTRVRLPLWRLVERFIPQINVMAINEVAPGVEIESVGVVKVD